VRIYSKVDSQLRIVSLDETHGLDVTTVSLAPLGGTREFALSWLDQPVPFAEELKQHKLFALQHTSAGPRGAGTSGPAPIPPAPDGAYFESAVWCKGAGSVAAGEMVDVGMGGGGAGRLYCIAGGVAGTLPVCFSGMQLLGAERTWGRGVPNAVCM